MGDEDPTELAATETETASVQAWALDDEYEDDPPPARFTPGRITTAAVAASLVAITTAGLLAWQHLRDEPDPTAAASSMVPATPMTTLAIPAAAPAPPAVIITAVIKRVPPTIGWLPHTGVPPVRPSATGGTSLAWSVKNKRADGMFPDPIPPVMPSNGGFPYSDSHRAALTDAKAAAEKFETKQVSK